MNLKKGDRVKLNKVFVMKQEPKNCHKYWGPKFKKIGKVVDVLESRYSKEYSLVEINWPKIGNEVLPFLYVEKAQ